MKKFKRRKNFLLIKFKSRIMKKILYLILFLTVSFHLFGQDRVYRQYATQEVERRMLTKYPDLAEEKSRIERHVHNHRTVGERPNITIPIVFHILYSPEKELLDQSLLLTQLNQLNLDFTVDLADLDQKYPVLVQEFVHPAETLAEFSKSKVKKIGVKFCLAKDELGLLPSINFHRSDSLEWSINDNMKNPKFGGISSRNPQKYLNIWIVSLKGNYAGYAQMPGGGLAETDGIVIDSDFISNPNNKDFPYSTGRTLSHLVGSYLGLYELWNQNNKCGDDYVTDTPIHNAPNYGPTSQYKHISLCSKDYPVEMSMNIMDNSDDAYTYLLTQGQTNRMYAMLAKGGPRYNLTQSESICVGLDDLTEMANSRNKIPEELVKEPMVTIQPNPVKDDLNILIEGGGSSAFITVYTSSGQVIANRRNELLSGNTTIQLKTGDWLPGMYFLHIHSEGINQSYPFLVVR